MASTQTYAMSITQTYVCVIDIAGVLVQRHGHEPVSYTHLDVYKRQDVGHWWDLRESRKGGSRPDTLSQTRAVRPLPARLWL